MQTALALDSTQDAHHPLADDRPFCVVIPNFLSQSECAAMIALSESRGYASAEADYPPSYRNNERQVIDDSELARTMLRRLQGIAPATLDRVEETSAASSRRWTLDSVNERFRFCRYRPGQRFSIHQDGIHHRGDTRQSCLTFMVYLTDGSEFTGGDTVFYSDGPGGDEFGSGPGIIGRVRPRAGSLILFDHALWHAGEVVTEGVKHIMRSDIRYRRASVAPYTPAGPFQPGHHGYVWTLARLDDGTVASGGRDTTIRIWSSAGELLRQLNGHGQSVLGLTALAGKRMASVSRDRSMRFWDIESGKCERVVLTHNGAVLTVAALPDNKVVTGGADAKIMMWNDRGDAIATLSGHTGWVWAVSPIASNTFASASEDGSVIVWDHVTGRRLQTLHGATALRTLTVSEDGKYLIVGNIAGEVEVWEDFDEEWKMVQRFQGHTAAVRRARVVSPGVLATAGEDNYLRIWCMRDWRLLYESKHDNFVTDVALINNSYLSCSYDGSLRMQTDSAAGIHGIDEQRCNGSPPAQG